MKNKSKVVLSNNEDSAECLESDICIVGAGSSGFMAALQAAKLGKKVILVDSSPTLGGQAANSMIGLFCGLYSRTNPNYLFTYGLVEDLLNDLNNEDAIYYRDSGVTLSIAYDEQALLRWIENQMITNNVQVITGACINKVTKNNNRVESIELLSRFGRISVKATGYVDASGDAALTYYAGLPCRESDVGPVYGTQMLIVEKINFDMLPGEEEIKSVIRTNGPQFGIERHDGLVFLFPTKDRIIVNMTHIETPLDPLGASMAAIEGKRRADRAYAFLKSEFPQALRNSTVHAYGQLGIRQTRWIVGKRQLIADDIRKGVRFDDAIARTTWPIELHDTLQTHQWEPFDNKHVHYVPFSSMTPPDVENLVAAGRCIDADLIALSSVRVMGPCMAMGIAAAHALDLAGTNSIHDIDVSILQERIHENLDRTDSLYFGDIHGI